MKKQLICITLLFLPVLSIAEENSATEVNQPENLTITPNEIDSNDNESFLIAFSENDLRFTTNITPVKNIQTCERLKSLLEQPKIKREIYYGDIRFKCLTVEDKK